MPDLAKSRGAFIHFLGFVTALSGVLAAGYLVDRSDIPGFLKWAIDALLLGITVAWASGEFSVIPIRCIKKTIAASDALLQAAEQRVGVLLTPGSDRESDGLTVHLM